MTADSLPDQSVGTGQPAPMVRFFGWITLGVLAAFFICNILIVGWGFPPARQALSGDLRSFVLVAIYVVGLALAMTWVLRTSHRSLRHEARAISDFNAYLIRACFITVLFVGLVDAAIAFLRVEGMLDQFFPEDFARSLSRSRFVGPYIHVPLTVAAFVVAWFSRSLGFVWLALLIVLAEFLIVVSRFVFSYEQAFMGDLVHYWYAALFLFASAYTLLEEGHVRVDVFYSGFGPRRRGRVNAIGSILFGMITCWAIVLIGMGSAQAIINAPIRNFEISQSGPSGMFIKYQMAGFLAVFAITMLIQFVSYLFQAVADARGEPGGTTQDSTTV